MMPTLCYPAAAIALAFALLGLACLGDRPSRRPVALPPPEPFARTWGRWLERTPVG